MQEFWLSSRKNKTKKKKPRRMLLAVVKIKSGGKFYVNGRAIRYQCPQKTEKVALNIAYAELVFTSTRGLIETLLGVPDAEGLLQLLAPLLDLKDTATQI